MSDLAGLFPIPVVSLCGLRGPPNRRQATFIITNSLQCFALSTLLGNLTILIYHDLCALSSYHFNLHVHFLREAVDLPMREAPICDLLAIILPPLAVLGLVL